MKSTNGLWMLVLLVGLAVVVGACGGTFERNPDDSWTVTAEATEADVQEAIDAAIADPLIRGVTADLREGYIVVTAERERLDGSETDTLTFRLDLGVSDGHLAATISDAQLDGEPIDEARVAVWNERIANRLENIGGRRPNSTLQSVTIGGDLLTMVWRIEPRQ